MLGLEGFSNFARGFAAAIEANDTEWLIDHSQYETVVCPSLGLPTPLPPVCGGMAPPPSGPGISLGAWNSEGDMVTEQYYEAKVRGSGFRDGSMYAIGVQKYGLLLGPSEVGIVVVYPGRQPLQTPVLPDGISAFRVDLIDGEWKIVGIDAGVVPDVPYFFKWYARWDDVFSPS